MSANCAIKQNVLAPIQPPFFRMNFTCEKSLVCLNTTAMRQAAKLHATTAKKTLWKTLIGY